MKGTLATGLSRYFSQTQLAALGTMQVGIIGAGGLGSNVAMMLVRTGIRNLTIADPDTVDASNLNRQYYMPDDVGQPKVTALSRYLLALEPELNLVLHECAVTRENAVELYGHCPIIVEAVDVAETKAALYEIFARQSALYVTASGMAGYGTSGKRAMLARRIRHNAVSAGDLSSAVSDTDPPLAPRVTIAAGLQADAVVEHILSSLP